MRKRISLLFVFCLTAALGWAQAPQSSVCQIVTNKVKPGMTAQYEAARKKHMAWHKSQNDTWPWAVWAIQSGENTGNYIVGSCGHPWKDFQGRDKFDDADEANIAITVGPTLDKQTVAYYVLRTDLVPALPDTATPPAFLQITHFYVKPEGISDFTDGVRKVTAAMAKTNYSSGTRSQWYSLANGGKGPEFVLVTERKSIADMEAPAKSLDEMMKDAYGDQGATIMTALRKAYYYSESELLQFRSDLGYMPAPAKK
jgi:hypothetical protein